MGGNALMQWDIILVVNHYFSSYHLYFMTTLKNAGRWLWKLPDELVEAILKSYYRAYVFFVSVILLSQYSMKLPAYIFLWTDSHSIMRTKVDVFLCSNLPFALFNYLNTIQSKQSKQWESTFHSYFTFWINYIHLFCQNRS